MPPANRALPQDPMAMEDVAVQIPMADMAGLAESSAEETPTKPINLEGYEVTFRVSPSGKYILVKDYKGGRPHKSGGETIDAEEGLVIFPKEKREEALEAYKNNDNLHLETMRLALPEDKAPKPEVKKYASGTSGIATIKSKPDLSISEMNYLDPYRAPLEQIYESPYASQNNFLGTAANVAQGIVGLGPSLYNIGRSLFSKPEKVTRREYKPEEYEAYYDINPQIRDLYDTRNSRVSAARNYSGGNVGAVLSNINQANVDTGKALSDLRTQKFNIESGIRRGNIDNRNQAQLQNIGLQNQYDDLDARNREARMAGLAEGLTGTSAYGQSRQRTGILNEQARNQDALLQRYNEQLLGLAQTSQYRAVRNPDGTYGFVYKGSGQPVPAIEDRKIRQTIGMAAPSVTNPLTGNLIAAPATSSTEEFSVAPIDPLSVSPLIPEVASSTRTPSSVAVTQRQLPNYSLQSIVPKVIQAESSGRAGVTSNKGAMGLMQVMPDTWREWAPRVGAKDPNNPADNRKVGTAYLNSLQKQFGGDMRLALIAYNWGPGNTQKWLSRGGRYSELPTETRNYIFKILGERI